MAVPVRDGGSERGSFLELLAARFSVPAEYRIVPYTLALPTSFRGVPSRSGSRILEDEALDGLVIVRRALDPPSLSAEGRYQELPLVMELELYEQKLEDAAAGIIPDPDDPSGSGIWLGQGVPIGYLGLKAVHFNIGFKGAPAEHRKTYHLWLKGLEDLPVERRPLGSGPFVKQLERRSGSIIALSARYLD